MAGLGNKTCEFCQSCEASHFCNCVQPPALFCLDCCGRHSAKFPRTIHHAIPIAALSQNPNEYKRRSKTITKATVELRKNIERLEQCHREFADMMQKCIAFLTEYRELWLQRLQLEKENLQQAIEAAIQETTDCLDKDMKPVSPLARAIWSVPTEELEVFSYSVNPPSLQTLCESWAFYQNYLQSLCERFSQSPLQEEVKEESLRRSSTMDTPSDVFAAVFEDKVELYDLNTQQSTRHTLAVNFGIGGSYLALDKRTLLCLGANPASTAVYSLDLLSLQLTPLPLLRIPRLGAGVAKTSHFVYVFGSYPEKTVCEKYALHAKQWLPLPDMKHGRVYFTPCTFRALIYLPCPWATPVVETFRPETEVFTELPVTLPLEMTKGWWSVAMDGSASFVVNGELCVLNEGMQMARWNIQREAGFSLVLTDRVCWSTQPPLLIANSLVFIANCGKVEKFSLESYTFL